MAALAGIAIGLIQGGQMPLRGELTIQSTAPFASHTHHAPHIGLPHRAPVHSERKAISAPVGASACAIMPDSRVLKASPMAAQKAITR